MQSGMSVDASHAASNTDEKILRIDPNQPYTRPSIVLTAPWDTRPILPSAESQASYLAEYCRPLESELLHQVTLFKAHLRSIESGPEFWRTLAKGLTNLLGAQYASISKRLDTVESNTGLPSLDKEGSCIVALAWYYNCGGTKTGLYEDVKYSGYGAPCSLMKHDMTAMIPTGLMDTFANNPNQDSFVVPPDAYLSVPMFDPAGVNMGHICLLWTKEGVKNCPYSWTTMEFVLHVFTEMAMHRFIEGRAAEFEKEEILAKAALNLQINRNSHPYQFNGNNNPYQSDTQLQEVTVQLPTPATEVNTPHMETPVHNNAQLFLPFPAAVAANISHEIRTPLQGIIGLLEILYHHIQQPYDAACDPRPAIKSLLEGIQDNSSRLMHFADQLGEYYSIASHAPTLEGTPPSRKRKYSPDPNDEEILWATGGAQRKFLRRRKFKNMSTTDGDESSSTDTRMMEAIPRSGTSQDPSCYQVSIRSTIRQIVKHVLTRHEVAAIWGGKKLGLMMHDPETRMRSLLLGEGDESLLLEWRIAEDVPRWLYCGRSGLQKAITQLLVNAIKFTPVGKITVEVTRESTNLSPNMGTSETVLISIKDTGIGVDEQHQGFLAQPFFQVDPSKTRRREGAGLGLMLTHRWALKVGGELRLVRSSTSQNDAGCGSEFSLRLPIDKYVPPPDAPEVDESDDEWTDSSKSSETSVEAQTESHFRRKEIASHAYDSHLASIYPLKIMVVEDNEILRRLMAQLLEKLGYQSSQIVLCNNGQEAVDYFRRRAPKEYDIDLILMDCWMPIMDGIDATRLILDMFPSGQKHLGVKPDIVAITADNLPANLAKTEDSGMRGYMVKPIKLHDLQRVVEECAEGNWVMKKT